MAKAPSKTSAKTASKSPGKTVRKKTAKAPARAEKAPVNKAELVEPEIVDFDDDSDIIEPEIIDPGQAGSFTPEEGDAIQIDIDPDRDIDESALPVIKPEIVDKGEDSKALATTDPVAIYLAEIRKYPLLTKEQERELAIRYRENADPRAAELLVTSNLRFVVKVAAEYSRFGAKLIDLIQEGNVGLMHAVKEFNPYKGVRLITYAVWWIRGYIQEYLMRQYSMVRIGTTQNQRKLFYRLQKEREAMESMGVEPSTPLLAGRLGVTEEEVETMTKRMSGRDVSLSTPVDGQNSVATLLDFEPSTEQAIDEAIGQSEEMQILRENIEKIRKDLSEKELYILEKRVLADEPLTLQEIGEHYGVTREAVRQLEARLIGKLRTAVTSSLGTEE